MSIPNIPTDPSIIYIAVLLLLIGLFLFISGLEIVKVEKITVSKGFKTWFIGLVLMSSGLILMIPKIQLTLNNSQAIQKNSLPPQPQNSGNNKQRKNNLNAQINNNPNNNQYQNNLNTQIRMTPEPEVSHPKSNIPSEPPPQTELISNSKANTIKHSKKTYTYNGKWSGVSSKIYIEWENYTGENGGVRGFVETKGGEIIEAFDGKNYAYRKLRLSLSGGSSIYLSATANGNIKTWSAPYIKFSRKYK